MKKSILKKLLLAAVIPFMGAAMTACDNEDPMPEVPKIQVFDGNEEVTSVYLPIEGGSKTVSIVSNNDWTLYNVLNWLEVTPNRGGKGTTTVTLTAAASATPNTGEIEFRISNTRKVALTVTSGQDDRLFYEDMGSASSTVDVSAYTDWTKGGALNQDAVTYQSTGGSVRTSMPPTGGSGYSGAPVLFLNSGSGMRDFTIKNINVTGNEKLTLRIAAGILEGDFDAGTQAIVEPDTEDLKVYAGYDGSAWAELTYTTAADGSWYWVTSEFAVAPGTTSIFVKIENYNNQARYDDFQIVAGGDGALLEVEVPEEPTIVPLATVRGLATGSITENYAFKASIISDASTAGGNSTSFRNVIVSDGTSGIMLRFAANPAVTYNVGDEILVKVKNVNLTRYQDLLQLENIAESNVTKTGETVQINPTEITAAQLLTGDYESMLVSVKDVQFAASSAGKAINDPTLLNEQTQSQSTMVSTTNEEFMVFVTQYASFYTTYTLPSSSGTMKGIASINNGNIQLLPQTASDFEGLNQPRFGTDQKYMNIIPNTAQTVGAAAGSLSFTVDANVAWTVSSTDNTNFAVTPASGTNSGTVTVNYTANSSTTGTRTATITFATTDTGVPAADRTVEVVITQSAVSAGGDFTVSWNMDNVTDWGVSPMDVTGNTASGDITVGGLTKTAFTTNGSSGARNWGGSDFTVNTESNYVTAPAKYATFTLTPSGKTMSLSSVALRIRATRTGPMKTSIQYQIGSGSFTEAGSFTLDRPSGTTNFPVQTVDLSAISALQNIAAGTTVTIRIVPVGNEGTEASGNWYLSNNGDSIVNPLEIKGTLQ